MNECVHRQKPFANGKYKPRFQRRIFHHLTFPSSALFTDGFWLTPSFKIVTNVPFGLVHHDIIAFNSKIDIASRTISSLPREGPRDNLCGVIPNIVNQICNKFTICGTRQKGTVLFNNWHLGRRSAIVRLCCMFLRYFWLSR